MKIEITTKTYVERFYAGSFFSQTIGSEVSDRNAWNVQNDQGVYAFRFYDRLCATIDDEVLLGQRKDISGMIFVQGEIFKPEEIPADVPNVKHNLSEGEWAIKTHLGNWQPYVNGVDTVLEKVARV